MCLSPEGSGGRRTASSPKLRGNASAPCLCPASSVTTATSPVCPRTRSHRRGRWRTRCLVHTHSSPTWTCSPGRNRTQVRKTTTAAGLLSQPRLSLQHPFQIPGAVQYPEFNLATGCCATRWSCISAGWASNSRGLRRPAVTQSVSSGAPDLRHAQVQMEDDGEASRLHKTSSKSSNKAEK